ncbi:unnamed protein product [Orchesella dallaii]|uniref:Cytochrome P450 n=1 Tax=Orchesella dallaii TaxID=48710 RepID=A0ABP1REA0_9HEXA
MINLLNYLPVRFESISKLFEGLDSIQIILLITVLCIIISYVFCDPGGKRRQFVQHVEKIPGPVAFPLIGNAFSLLFPPDEIFYWLEEVYKKWGDISRFWVFRSPKIFVNSYDIAMQLLTRKNFLLKSEEFEPLAPIAKYSLPGATPQVHPIRRKMLGPGFSRQTVEKSFEIFNKHARALCHGLGDLADRNVVFNALTQTGLCSYMIGCETAFGHEIMRNLTETDYRNQMYSWHTLLVNTVNRSFQPWFKSDYIYNLTQPGKQNLECFERINSFGENAIASRRSTRNSWDTSSKAKIDKSLNPLDAFKSSMNIPLKSHCYLDLLLDLEEKKELTKEDVLHELNLFIVAGYDTTGTTAAWTLHLLASNPECQRKAHEELQTIFGNRKGTDLQVTVEDIKQMKFLDGCIKEALRLFPVLPWLLRRTDEEIRLNDGTILPEGVDIPINTFLIQRNPTFFPEPDKFQPERHFPGSTSNIKAMLPFGAGPRICPGMLFGMHELKIILAHLLLSYSWESLDDPKKMKCVFHGVLLPKDGINVKICRVR